MRILFIGLAIGVAATGLVAAPVTMPLPERKPPVPPINDTEVQDYARNVSHAAEDIARVYVRPVPPEKLAAAGLEALHKAAGVPLPERMRPDPARWLAGRDLYIELAEARRALGNPPAIAGSDTRISIEGMLKSLDPYSLVMTPAESRRMSDGLANSYGSGILVAERLGLGPLTVRDVLLGSPAQQAGMQLGDKLLAINGQRTDAMSAAEAEQALNAQQAPINRKVTVLVQPRHGVEPQTIELTIQHFIEETVLGHGRSADGSWDFRLDRSSGIGLIRVRFLNRGSAQQVRQAVEQLRERNLRGIILDLRECPGGFLDEATALADLFLGDCTIATARYRDERLSAPQVSRAAGSVLDIPLAVLIGPETTGGGELIAAALQDNKRAMLFGERTRGKSTVQRTHNLAITTRHHVTSLELKLSTGMFERPSGRNINRFADSKPDDEWGVDPDPEGEIRLTSAAHAQIREWRRLQDLRPFHSREALPLDRLENDPVLHAAVRRLRGLPERKPSRGRPQPGSSSAAVDLHDLCRSARPGQTVAIPAGT